MQRKKMCLKYANRQKLTTNHHINSITGQFEASENVVQR